MLKRIAVALLLTLWMMPAAQAITYHGGLTSAATSSDPDIVPNGIQGTGIWLDPGPTMIEWWVTQDQLTDPWHYKYVFSPPGNQGVPSHFVLETTNPFAEGEPDYFNATGDFSGEVVGNNLGSSPGNPSMPGDIYGLKFEPLSGDMVITIEFDSFRNPVWGDFYSKCGGAGGIQNTAWNVGLTANDTDPNLAPTNGSINYHILRPNGETQDIPEPGTMALFGLGLAAAVYMRLRKR